MTTADFDIEKNILTNNLNFLKGMSVDEYLVYKKFDELRNYNCSPSEIRKAKARLWDGDSIETVKPIVQIIGKKGEDPENYDLWILLRHLITMGEFNNVPTSVVHFFVNDEITGKILGIGNIIGDFFSVKERDDFIGWTTEQKKSGLLNHTAIGATIVPVQPFGYNFLGGKLIASLVATSQVIRDEWKRKYGNTLVGFTTTSLYGKFSMYDRIPCWKALGETTGKVSILPDESIQNFWREWFMREQKEQYKKLQEISTTNTKARINRAMFATIGLNPMDYNHGHRRGVYFSECFTNTKDFLCGRINESQLIPKTFNAVEWWKTKAVNRYNRLKEENRLQTEQLFLDTLPLMSWEQVKRAYLPQPISKVA